MSDAHLPLARVLIKKHEGLRLKPYDDSTGKPVVKGSTIYGKVSVGFGRNLEDVGISEDEADMLLERDLKIAEAGAFRYVGPDVWDKLSPARKAALTDLSYNMGAAKLAKFRNMLASIQQHDWTAAAQHLLDSRYAEQVRSRALRIAEIMRTGQMPAS